MNNVKKLTKDQIEALGFKYNGKHLEHGENNESWSFRKYDIEVYVVNFFTMDSHDIVEDQVYDVNGEEISQESMIKLMSVLNQI